MIIGMTGPAGSGKDAAAKALIGTGWKRFAFADELKRIVNELFGWDEKYANGTLKEKIDSYWGFSPRRAYQLFGTEFGRALSEDLWIKKAEKTINFNDNIVITDVRFENEASFVRQHGHLIHIMGRECGGVSQHSSETGVKIDMSDFVIYNTGTIDTLQWCILNVKHYLMTA